LDVWERSFTNHRINDKHDYTTHLTYIHQNPVRANLASEPSLYPNSSANPTHESDPSPIHLS
jgi:putative transposase